MTTLVIACGDWQAMARRLRVAGHTLVVHHARALGDAYVPPKGSFVSFHDPAPERIEDHLIAASHVALRPRLGVASAVLPGLPPENVRALTGLWRALMNHQYTPLWWPDAVVKEEAA